MSQGRSKRAWDGWSFHSKTRAPVKKLIIRKVKVKRRVDALGKNANPAKALPKKSKEETDNEHGFDLNTLCEDPRFWKYAYLKTKILYFDGDPADYRVE